MPGKGEGIVETPVRDRIAIRVYRRRVGRRQDTLSRRRSTESASVLSGVVNVSAPSLSRWFNGSCTTVFLGNSSSAQANEPLGQAQGRKIHDLSEAIREGVTAAFRTASE